MSENRHHANSTLGLIMLSYVYLADSLMPRQRAEGSKGLNFCLAKRERHHESGRS